MAKIKMVAKVRVSEENTKARNTDTITCCNCGEIIPEKDNDNNDVFCYRVDGMPGYSEDGKAVHFCINCTRPVMYHGNRRENRTGTDNYTWIRKGDFSLEIEACSVKYPNLWGRDFEYVLLNDMDYATIHFTACMCGKSASGKGQQAESDCTVVTENHMRGRDAKSAAAWFRNRSEAQLDCLRNDRCGCHMHVNCNYHFSDDIWFKIWNPVFQCMKFKDENGNPNEAKMIEYWGRTFTTYAMMEKGFHGDAINWHTGHNTVEFRLPHVRTADQIIRCLKFWRACVDVVNRVGHKVEANPNKADWLGQKIVRECFIPLINGTKFYKGY